jgi:hypothetical protein
VELQSFLSGHAVDFPHMGRVDHSQDHNSGNGASRGNGKRPLNNGAGGANGNDNKGKKSRPDEHEDGSNDKGKDKGQGIGRGKEKLRNGRRINFNAIVKALTPKEQQRDRNK